LHKYTQKLDFAVRLSLFNFVTVKKNYMKLIKTIVPLMAAFAVLVSCEKTEEETISYDPTHAIITDGDGVNLYKKEYTYYDSKETYSQILYEWKGSSWEQTHEYVFKYAYGPSLSLIYYTATDNGKLSYRYDYEYNSRGLVEYQKYTDYSGAEEKTEEYGFNYEIEDYNITVRYIFVPADGDNWKEYAKEEYEYDSQGNNTKLSTYLMVDEKYVDSAVADFTYSSGVMTGSVEWKIINSEKLKYRTIDYSYDQHGRRTSITTVVYNLDASPVTSTKTIEHIYYKD